VTTTNRIDPRANVRVGAEYRLKGSEDWIAGFLHDLSASGASLLAQRSIPVQSFVSLRFSIPASGAEPAFQVTIDGLVVRSLLREDLDPTLPHFHGVLFLDLRGETYERLRRCVWERLGGKSS
jgi:hypothetical protein